MPKDLEFIRKHVKAWPEGATSVRLDIDGQIVFEDVLDEDIYPDGCNLLKVHPSFTAKGGFTSIGEEYTREQWAPNPACNLHQRLQCPSRKGEQCTSAKPCRNKETPA